MAKSGKIDKTSKIRQNRQNKAELAKLDNKGIIRHSYCFATIQRSKAECQQKISKISRHTEARRRKMKIFWTKNNKKKQKTKGGVRVRPAMLVALKSSV